MHGWWTIAVSGGFIAGISLPAVAQRGDVAEEPQPDVLRDLVVPPAPVRAPEDALATFEVLPGFRVDLVAAEPLVDSPVAIAFDERGRLWVLEMRSYMPDADGAGEEEPTSRIRILEDRDADGRFDHATTFLDGLIMPRAVAPTHGGALLIEPPSLFFCPDADGDGVAEQKIDLGVDLGAFENPEHGPNGLLRTIDNRFALSDGTALISFDGRAATSIPCPPHGQWGVAMDDVGRLFYTPNSESLRGDLLPKEHALRNPRQRWLEGVNWPVGEETAVFPIRVTPGVNRGYRPGTLREDGTLANLTAACSPVFNRADRLGPDLAGDAFICEPAAHCVKWLELSERDGLPVARNALRDREFLASTDERFRPVALAIGLDGALYVADFHRGVIQHKTYMTTFLREQIDARGLATPIGLGRIWRVAREDHPPEPPRELPLDRDGLVSMLGDSNGTVRDLAQRLLIERFAGDPALPAILAGIADSSGDPRERLHAAWTHEGVEASSGWNPAGLLVAPEPALRAAAIRILERRRPAAVPLDDATIDAIWRLAEDPDRLVRAQLALALADSGPRRVELLTALSRRDGDDRIIRSAIVNSACGAEARLLDSLIRERLVASDADLAALEIRLGPVIRELGGLLLLGSDEEVLALLDRLSSTAVDAPEVAAWLLAALVEHLRLDSPTPRSLTIPREPDGWSAMLAARRDAMPRLAGCDAQLRWAGKESATAPARVLTASEQRRFADGKRLYVQCLGCHGADGEGVGGTYPPLNGSPVVLGSPGILARVLLHGLEGPVTIGNRTWNGAMVKAPLRSDEELAAVMTYVRRAWGNAADPVAPAEVARVRQATAGRAAPWTISELEAIDAP